MNTLQREQKYVQNDRQGEDVPLNFKIYIIEYLLQEIINKKIKNCFPLIKFNHTYEHNLRKDYRFQQNSLYLLQTTKNSKNKKNTAFKRKVMRTEVQEQTENQLAEMWRTGSPQRKNFLNNQEYNFKQDNYSKGFSLRDSIDKDNTSFYQIKQNYRFSPIKKVKNQRETSQMLSVDEQVQIKLDFQKKYKKGQKKEEIKSNICCYHKQFVLRTRRISLNLFFSKFKKYLKSHLGLVFNLLKQAFLDSFEENETKDLTLQIHYKRLFAQNMGLNQQIEELKDQLVIYKSDLELKNRQLEILKQREKFFQKFIIFMKLQGVQRKIRVEFFSKIRRNFSKTIYKSLQSDSDQKPAKYNTKVQYHDSSPQNSQFRVIYKSNQQQPFLKDSKLAKKRKLTIKKSQLFQPQSQSAKKIESSKQEYTISDFNSHL